MIRPTAIHVAACCLPLPALFMTDPAHNAEIACVYLGVACAWLAGQLTLLDAPAHAVALAIAINLVLFLALGLCVEVRSQIPFPLLAALSTIPAIGLIPTLTRRLGDPYRAILAAAVILLAAKIAGCAVARIAYGPTFIEAGYVDGDWQNARLMIATFWGLTMVSSVALASFGWLRRGAR